MTDITPLIRRDAQVIQAYGPDFIKVSGQVFKNSILVFPDGVQTWSGQIDDLLSVKQVDLFLWGKAGEILPLGEDMRQKFRAQGIGLEIMDIGAACRTYNVLMAEGRKVAVALQLN